jgi:hypothetical protein
MIRQNFDGENFIDTPYSKVIALNQYNQYGNYTKPFSLKEQSYSVYT